MNPRHLRLGAALLTAGVFALVLLGARQGASVQTGEPGPEGKQIVAVPENLVSLLLTLGIGDDKGTDWSGEITLSEGKLLNLAILEGNPKKSVSGSKFSVRTVLAGKKAKKKKKDTVTTPVLRASLDAPGSAKVKIVTAQGTFQFTLDDLPATGPATFLDGRVKVLREDAVLRLTRGPTEEDYPALAKAADGGLWLVYSEYTFGKPYVSERVLAGSFEDLVPKGNGDRIKLRHFDGKSWSPPLNVTEGGQDIWRPTVAVDGAGAVHVVWSLQKDGDWNIYRRKFTPGQGEKGGTWSDVEPVTREKGNDIHVVAATDANGDVWLAWQAWRDGFFRIMVQKSGAAAKQITTARANHWTPAIAADALGNVYVAYDTYEKGNYDVRVQSFGTEQRTFTVASSARFEARPHLACDAKNRVWISYEEGDEQWGKDYATPQFSKIGLASNPGFPLYLNRTLRVKCIERGEVKVPAGDLQAVLNKRTARNKTMGRLAVDAAGGIWLTYRHHPKPLGAGEVWVSFATRYDGRSWSPPRLIPQSENLMDLRPALAPFDRGVVMVFPGDARNNQQTRTQNDLFAATLTGGPAQAPKLAADPPPPAAQVAPVHPNEAEQVARIRAHRTEYQGKKLHLYRGEFHRHTEYTAHRDQDGLLEDSWRYALDAGSLDWMGNGDHDNGHHNEYSWWQIQKVADLFNHSPVFTAVQSYERSNKYPNGHRNVIFPKRGVRPLPRGILKGTEEAGTPDTKILYRYLKHFGGMCSSHTSATGMGTDWRDNDPVVEPVVEIYQGHRHNYEEPGAPRSPTAKTQIGGFEPKGFVNLALAKGYRLGFQSSSDHISTHMSYGMVLTDDLSRQGIIDAFRRRHSYGATDNIIVEFRCGEHMMGDIFDTRTRPKFEARVLGTAPIAKIHLVRDGKHVHVVEPKREEARFSWTDPDAPAGTTSYYYIRVEQQDGNLAWASPMWITYRP